MNIHTHACKRKEQFGKMKKDVLIKHLEELYEEAVDSHKSYLADLYSHFLPPAPKVAKTAVDWVFKAVYKGNARPCLQNIYCDGENIVATGGHRLHMAKAPEGTEVGFYNQMGKKINGVNYTFPDYKRVIPVTNATSNFINLKTMENVLKVSYISEYSKSKGEKIFLKIGGNAEQVCVNKKYLLDALNGETEFVVCFKDLEDKYVKMHNEGNLTCYAEPILIKTVFGQAVIISMKDGRV